MADTNATYSNAGLQEKIPAALRSFDAAVVCLDLKHEDTIARFTRQVQRAYDLSRQTPVRLRRQ